MKINITICLFFFSVILCAQNLPKSDFVKYKFVNLAADTVSNDQALKSLFEKLNDVKNRCLDAKVSIVHIGDSHIHGDFLTSVVRTHLQHYFGNGGRGLIFPHRLVGLYEARDIVSFSENKWNKTAITTLRKEFDPGLAGFSIQTDDSLAVIDLTTLSHDSLSYAFSKMNVICRSDSSNALFLLRDSTLGINKLSIVGNDFSHPFSFDTLTNHIQLVSEGNLILDGFVLENNEPGVLYHVLGVHGAHFSEFVDAGVLFEELHVLQPDVVLVSLGTNDGVNNRITRLEIKQSIEELVLKLERSNPGVSIVLITPFDNYYRRRTNNKYLRIIQKAIVDVAKGKNIAYIDAYGITGGYGSASQWKKFGFLRSDGIHYTKEAYNLQAKIIYQAFINSYLKYADN